MSGPRLHLDDALGQPSADKRIDILRRIGAAGSISEAARGAGVSYKAAWQAIDTLSNLAGAPLVERVVGGYGGGGARLTRAGQRLLDAAQSLHRARDAVLARIAADQGGGAAVAPLSALAVRTSMRNQLPCTVSALRAQGGAIRVELALADGTTINARITRESAQLLGLSPGVPALALCKATAVRVAPTILGAPGRNLLEGRVTRASRAAAGGEVALGLNCGLQLVGFAERGGVLKARSPAMACVEESAVVVALTG